MSTESKKINSHGIFLLQLEAGVLDTIPKSKFIKFNFNSLEPRRRSIALKQIEIYEKKYKLFPQKNPKKIYIIKVKNIEYI